MKWLVTAFEPFGGAASNSSLIVLEQLRQRDWGGRVVFMAPVPVQFEKAWSKISETLGSMDECAGVLALGQAESRSRIGLERVALNVNDARMPDNTGYVPVLGPVQPGAPDMYWCNIPWENYSVSALSERSYSAGTYVCNNVMFQSLRWAVAAGKKAGFVHIPVLSSQDEPAFKDCPRIDDQAAVAEVARIVEFVLNL